MVFRVLKTKKDIEWTWEHISHPNRWKTQDWAEAAGYARDMVVAFNDFATSFGSSIRWDPNSPTDDVCWIVRNERFADYRAKQWYKAAEKTVRSTKYLRDWELLIQWNKERITATNEVLWKNRLPLHKTRQ